MTRLQTGQVPPSASGQVLPVSVTISRIPAPIEPVFRSQELECVRLQREELERRPADARSHVGTTRDYTRGKRKFELVTFKIVEFM